MLLSSNKIYKYLNIYIFKMGFKKGYRHEDNILKECKTKCGSYYDEYQNPERKVNSTKELNFQGIFDHKLGFTKFFKKGLTDDTSHEIPGLVINNKTYSTHHYPGNGGTIRAYYDIESAEFMYKLSSGFELKKEELSNYKNLEKLVRDKNEILLPIYNSNQLDDLYSLIVEKEITDLNQNFFSKTSLYEIEQELSRFMPYGR